MTLLASANLPSLLYIANCLNQTVGLTVKYQQAIGVAAQGHGRGFVSAGPGHVRDGGCELSARYPS